MTLSQTERSTIPISRSNCANSLIHANQDISLQIIDNVMKIVRKVRYVDIGLGVSEKERLTHDAALVRKRLHIARLNVSTFKQHSLSGFTLSPFHPFTINYLILRCEAWRKMAPDTPPKYTMVISTRETPGLLHEFLPSTTPCVVFSPRQKKPAKAATIRKRNLTNLEG